MISTFRNDLDAKRSPPSLTVNDRLVNDKRPTRKAASSQSINCWRLLAWLRGSLPPVQVKNEGSAETCLLSRIQASDHVGTNLVLLSLCGRYRTRPSSE